VLLLGHTGHVNPQGGSLPNGAELRFRGVERTLPDVLASIRYGLSAGET
jgi:hypothetical protein